MRTAFASKFVATSGIKTHIRDTGDVHDPTVTPSSDAPVLIAMHGFAGSTESWVDIAPTLANEGIRVIAIDRVGFGRTERPLPPALPPPPPLPFRETLATFLSDAASDEDDSEESPGSVLGSLVRGAVVTGLR